MMSWHPLHSFILVLTNFDFGIYCCFFRFHFYQILQSRQFTKCESPAQHHLLIWGNAVPNLSRFHIIVRVITHYPPLTCNQSNDEIIIIIIKWRIPSFLQRHNAYCNVKSFVWLLLRFSLMWELEIWFNNQMWIGNLFK